MVNTNQSKCFQVFFSYRRSSKPSRTRRSDLTTVSLQEDTVISQEANRRGKKKLFQL